jgi:hypothetical protein
MLDKGLKKIIFGIIGVTTLVFDVIITRVIFSLIGSQNDLLIILIPIIFIALVILNWYLFKGLYKEYTKHEK